MRNASAQARLIDDMLDVSRIISGKLRLSLRADRSRPVIRARARSVVRRRGARIALVEELAASDLGDDSIRRSSIACSRSCGTSVERGEVHRRRRPVEIRGARTRIQRCASPCATPASAFAPEHLTRSSSGFARSTARRRATRAASASASRSCATSSRHTAAGVEPTATARPRRGVHRHPARPSQPDRLVRPRAAGACRAAARAAPHPGRRRRSRRPRLVAEVLTDAGATSQSAASAPEASRCSRRAPPTS